MYEFHLAHRNQIDQMLINEMSNLYSSHYGVWGPGGRKPGQPISLSSDQITKWLTEDSIVVWATAFGEMIGYAIAVHAKLLEYGSVAWVTQFVVHKEHRQADVGRRILFSFWKFSDNFAWGVVSANPYAVRALEKATRRRCQPPLIARHAGALLDLGKEPVHYVRTSKGSLINENESRINTDFHVDHSELPVMLTNATDETKPWLLGNLPEGWEWFAFTFREQKQIPLTEKELEEMLVASDQVTKQAYSRMKPQWRSHSWAQYAKEEVE